VRQGSKRDTEHREFASTQFYSGQQGQAVFGREPNNEFAINISEDIRRQNKTAIVLAR
jgi:hypothetical protein